MNDSATFMSDGSLSATHTPSTHSLISSLEEHTSIMDQKRSKEIIYDLKKDEEMRVNLIDTSSQ